MIRPEFFIETLKENGIDCFAGVPDSLLRNICAYITDHFDAQHNIIAANEGAAIGLAAGHYLATGQPACVYMQNSGEGNIINPLASLTDPEVYNIPVLLLIGWRGRPGVHDEPQHAKQGKVTTGLLNVMGVNYEVLSKEEDKAAKQIDKAVKALQNKEVFALVIEKDTFEDYKLQNVEVNDLTMSREEAIQTVAATIGEKDCIVSTTGMISRELFEWGMPLRSHWVLPWQCPTVMSGASMVMVLLLCIWEVWLLWPTRLRRTMCMWYSTMVRMILLVASLQLD